MPNFENIHQLMPTINLDYNSDAAEAVMSTILYFDYFRHPLKEYEIYTYIHNHSFLEGEIKHTLEYLVAHEFLFFKNGFYLPNNNFENIERRINGKILADKLFPKAISMSRLISKFPFVKGVIISGSLSKGYMNENSDIDYLIITEPGRLWISRTLLALYKKVFHLNSHKFLCINYFLDLKNLSLNDHNIFTATELMFCIPTYNIPLYHKLISANPWARKYYPAFEINNTISISDPEKKHIIRNVIENLLKGKIGDTLNNFFRKLTVKFWSGKFHAMNKKQFERDMKSTDGISKHHPNGFRDKVLSAHQERLAHFRRKLKIVQEDSGHTFQNVMNS